MRLIQSQENLYSMNLDSGSSSYTLLLTPTPPNRRFIRCRRLSSYLLLSSLQCFALPCGGWGIVVVIVIAVLFILLGVFRVSSTTLMHPNITWRISPQSLLTSNAWLIFHVDPICMNITCSLVDCAVFEAPYSSAIS